MTLKCGFISIGYRHSVPATADPLPGPGYHAAVRNRPAAVRYPAAMTLACPLA